MATSAAVMKLATKPSPLGLASFVNFKRLSALSQKPSPLGWAFEKAPHLGPTAGSGDPPPPPPLCANPIPLSIAIGAPRIYKSKPCGLGFKGRGGSSIYLQMRNGTLRDGGPGQNCSRWLQFLAPVLQSRPFPFLMRCAPPARRPGRLPALRAGKGS